MNEEYRKLKKQIEFELTNEFRIRLIVKTIILYYGIGRGTVLGDSQLSPVVLVRHMISYVACFIYGVPTGLVTKHLKYQTDDGVYCAISAMKQKLDNNQRYHSDLENIRMQLAKVING